MRNPPRGKMLHESGKKAQKLAVGSGPCSTKRQRWRLETLNQTRRKILREIEKKTQKLVSTLMKFRLRE